MFRVFGLLRGLCASLDASVPFIEIFSATRERERGIEWGTRITERMRADQQTELANQVDEYLSERW